MVFDKNKRNMRRSATVQTRQTYNDYYKSQKSNALASVVRPESTKRSLLVSSRQNRAHFKRMPSYIALLCIAVAIFVASILNTTPKIIIEEDRALYNKQQYIDSASLILKDSLINKSKLTFDNVSFKNKFKNLHPEVNDVNVSIPLTSRQLSIGLSFITPEFLFKPANGNEVVVGANGVVLARSELVKKSVLQNLMIVADSAPIKTNNGTAVLLPSDVSFLRSVTEELKLAAIDVEKISLPVGAGEVHITTKQAPYIIKFLLSGDAKQQTGAYLAIKKQAGIINEKTEYIDVRLAERVFVK
ncbi:hypothetical protein EBQ81_03515 [bacterium]|nr:hypothetical protein [bacterium]NBX97904.1 hypothetical protein [bacterium]